MRRRLTRRVRRRPARFHFLTGRDYGWRADREQDWLCACCRVETGDREDRCGDSGGTDICGWQSSAGRDSAEPEWRSSNGHCDYVEFGESVRRDGGFGGDGACAEGGEDEDSRGG